MRVPGWLAGMVAVDRNGFQPLDGLRAATGVVLPLLVGAAVGHPAEGAQAAAGALPVGVAELTGSFRAPLGLMVVTTAGMGLSTFVGSLVAGHPVPALLVLAGWGFVAGLLVTLGRAATIAGVQAVVAMLVFGRYPGGVALSAAHAGWVMAGGGVQTLLAASLRPPRRFASERAALARALDRLAALADGVVDSAAGGPAAQAIVTARQVVGRRTLTDREGEGELRGLLDEAGRVRLELQSLGALPDLPHVRDVTVAAAAWLQRLAHAVADGTAVAEEDPTLARTVDHLRASADPGVRGRFAAARAAALLGQLRAADRLVTSLAGVRRLPLPRVAGVPSALELGGRAGSALRRLQLAATADRAASRHALRLAVLVTAADLLARWLPWQRGYWVALTVLVVLKPDYGQTVQRGLGRIAGTAVGVVVAGTVVAVLHPGGAVLVALVALAAWASYTVFAASYPLYSAVLTALVVLLVSTVGSKTLSTVADRGLDTLVGGAIALAGYLVWPTPEAPTLRATTGRLLLALADYAEEVLGAYVDPARLDRATISTAARGARVARVDAQASLDRALAEPARMRGHDVDAGTGVLAASRRIVVALHALRTVLQDAREHEPLPEAAAAAEAFPAALRAAASGDDPPVDLRDLQLGMQAAAAELLAASPDALRGRRLALLAAHLDPLVDSTDTVVHVVAGEV